MTAAELKLLGVRPPERESRGRYAHPAKPARLVLVLATPKRTIREVPLTRAELLKLIREAADVLERLDREDGRG